MQRQQSWKKRLAVLALLAALAAAYLDASFLLEEYAGHTCADTHCTLCQAIHLAQQMLQGAGTVVLAAGSLFLLIAAVGELAGTVRRRERPTLVSWKVKLTD